MLSLVEEILLLALDDQNGEFLPVPEYSLELAMAGAVLMDLALRDRLDADPQHLIVADPTPTGDDILDPILAELNGAGGELRPRRWLMRLARREAIRERVLQRLVERGILKRVERRLLWVFGSRRYPVIDDHEQREARLRILEVLLGDQIPTPTDVVLICLANACSLLESLLGPRELARLRPRIEQISRLDLIGQRMQQELADLHATVNRVGWWGVSES